MRIGVGGEADLRVAEQLRHDRDVHTGRESQAGRTMSKIMDADSADAGVVAQLTEVGGDHLRVQRVAVLPAEDQPVIRVGVGPHRPFHVLPETPFEQDSEGRIVEVDDPSLAAGRLGCGEHDPDMTRFAVRARVAASELHDRAAHHNHAMLEVGVLPPEPDRFAAPKSGRRDH
jgi:hypothetical protein